MKPRRPKMKRAPKAQYGYYHRRICPYYPYYPYYWDDYEYDHDYDYDYDWGDYDYDWGGDDYDWGEDYSYAVDRAYKKGFRQGMARAKMMKSNESTNTEPVPPTPPASSAT